jgi:hypothetical protein
LNEWIFNPDFLLHCSNLWRPAIRLSRFRLGSAQPVNAAAGYAAKNQQLADIGGNPH